MKFLKLILIIFISINSPVKADSKKNLIENLKKGGKLIFIRHAYAPGGGDPVNFNINDCATQRNLSESGRIQSKKITAFQFYGPTGDSLDYMKGPFLLPNNIKEGDYIELGQLGAYSLTFRTNFNGFYSNEIHELSDKPIISMYDNSNDKVGSLVA